MVKLLNLHFDDEAFKMLKEEKLKSGKTWEQFFLDVVYVNKYTAKPEAP